MRTTFAKAGTALLLSLLLVPACFSEPPAVISKIALKVLPPSGGGVAFIEFDSTGNVSSGSINPATGGVAPSARSSDTRIPAADAAAIFAAARALGDTLLDRTQLPAEVPGSMVIAILFSDDSQARIMWPAGQEHRDPRVRTLVQLINRHRVGAM